MYLKVDKMSSFDVIITVQTSEADEQSGSDESLDERCCIHIIVQFADRGFCAKPVTYANKSSSITWD